MDSNYLNFISADSNYHAINELHTLYMEAFPAEERRPWNDLIKLADKNDGTFNLLAIEDCAGRFIGFISTWNLPSAIYVEHFAVDNKMRGNGIGAKILSKTISSCNGKPMVLEVEPSTDNEMHDIAGRRIGFYKRNGFVLFTGYNYMQPPYTPELPWVKLMLMSTDSQLDPVIAGEEIHRFVYGVD